MNSPIKKTNTSIKSYIILLFSVTLATYVIYLFLIPALTPPQPPLDVHDIVYLERTDENGTIKFINADGSGASTRDVTFSVPRTINIFGFNIPLAYHQVDNQISTVTWGADGNTLAFSYENENFIVRFPGLLTAEGEILTCPQDDSLYTCRNCPVRVLDQERVLINVGAPYDGVRYLAVYNMRNCKQESVYFDGNREWGFALSSKNWLAISEKLDDRFVLNVYDDQFTLMHTIPTEDLISWIEWSPDGNQLLYRDSRDYDSYVKMFNYNTNEDQITEVGKDICCASFSPDAQKIIFSRDNQIYIRDLTTGQETYLTQGTNPQWRPK
jgi:WD40 repeat protein